MNGDKLLAVYNNVIEGNVTHGDIYTGDQREYNEKNRWNTRPDGAKPGDSGETEGELVHMIRANNTLFEAADLVADSTILYYDDQGKVMTDGRAILKNKMKVSEASPNRNSDPTVISLLHTSIQVTAADSRCARGRSWRP